MAWYQLAAEIALGKVLPPQLQENQVSLHIHSNLIILILLLSRYIQYSACFYDKS